jgi:hypothetical protein
MEPLADDTELKPVVPCTSSKINISKGLENIVCSRPFVRRSYKRHQLNLRDLNISDKPARYFQYAILN